MQEKASQVALYALFVDSELTARRQKAGFRNDDDLSDSFLQRLGDFVSNFVESLVPTSATQLYDIFKAMPFLKPFLDFITKLHSCDLCAGTWIYSILALATGVDMSGSQTIVTVVTTGILTSFAVHVFVIGLKEKFLPPTII